jgi:hypothetical protein
MDKSEARKILEEFVAGWQSRSYRQWQALLGEDQVEERRGSRDVVYQIEWRAFWDSEPGGNIRVMVSIDDGGLVRSIIPLTTSLLVSP